MLQFADRHSTVETMNDFVPFDPPYIIRINEEGNQWMAVREDGTQVPCAAPVIGPMPVAQEPAASGRARPNILNVPYAEKDEAKSLGARWDPKRKKWYVPPGVDAGPFSRWATDD